METYVSTQPHQPEYPLLGDRVQSTFIDSILIVILMFILASVLDRYEDVPTWVRISLFLGLWGLYEPLCTTLGGTLGNHIKGIRVRQAGTHSKKVNFIQAFVRYVLKL